MLSIRRPRLRAARRNALTAAALGAVLALATACGGGADKPSASGSEDSGTPVKGGVLKVSFFPDNPTFSCLDPFQTYWIEHRTIIRNFADSLTDQDPATGKLVPWLATSWKESKDGLTYTFHLRDGVTFSNGDKLDADAVVANVNGWLATVKATNNAAYGTSYILGLKGAKAIDPSTVEFDFSSPNSSFLQATSTTNLAIIDPSDYQESPTDRCLGKNLIASGPFTLESYKPNVETILKKRPGYNWGSSLEKNQGEAYLDEVDFNYVTEDSVRTGNLVSGAIDIDWPRNPFSPQDQELLQKSGDTLEQRSLPGVAYVQWPNTQPGRPLSDLQVRKAVIQATDLGTYATTVFGSGYPTVAGAFDSTTPYFSSQASKLAYDPDGAKKTLEADGYTLGSDGYYQKGGKDLELVLPITQFSAGAELFQSQLKTVGIKVTLKTITAAQQAELFSDPNADWDLTQDYFTRADPGALQFILNDAVANSKVLADAIVPQADRATIQGFFQKAIQTTDPQVTTQAYAALQSYLIDQGLALPLFERVQMAGVSPHVHGFAFTSESFLRLNDVWKS